MFARGLRSATVYKKPFLSLQNCNYDAGRHNKTHASFNKHASIYMNLKKQKKHEEINKVKKLHVIFSYYFKVICFDYMLFKNFKI